MTTPEPYTLRLTTLEATLRAERLGLALDALHAVSRRIRAFVVGLAETVAAGLPRLDVVLHKHDRRPAVEALEGCVLPFNAWAHPNRLGEGPHESGQHVTVRPAGEVAE